MPVHGLTTTRLHLLLGSVAALSGTSLGGWCALLVAVTTLLRIWARHSLGVTGSPGSSGAGVLTTPQGTEVLDPAGTGGQPLAGAGQAWGRPPRHAT